MKEQFDPQDIIKKLNKQEKIELLDCLLKDSFLKEKRVTQISSQKVLASLKKILAHLNILLPKSEKPNISSAAAFFDKSYSAILNRLPHHKLGLIYGSYLAALMTEAQNLPTEKGKRKTKL
jgi:hypothetical protein